jgi:hypothetical protein
MKTIVLGNFMWLCILWPKVLQAHSKTNANDALHMRSNLDMRSIIIHHLSYVVIEALIWIFNP